MNITDLQQLQNVMTETFFILLNFQAETTCLLSMPCSLIEQFHSVYLPNLPINQWMVLSTNNTNSYGHGLFSGAEW